MNGDSAKFTNDYPNPDVIDSFNLWRDIQLIDRLQEDVLIY